MDMSEMSPQTNPLTLNHKVCSTAVSSAARFAAFVGKPTPAPVTKARGIARKLRIGAMRREIVRGGF